jgi:hypothetical protein
MRYQDSLSSFAIAAAIWLAILGAACSSGRQMNSDRNTATSNASANFATNSTANQSITTHSAIAITTKTLSDALKERLMLDDQGVLTSHDWEQNKWMDERIGRFYKDDTEIARDRVCKATEELLQKANRRMTDVARRGLRAGVNSSSACKLVLSKMIDASLDTEPTTPIP